MQVPVPLLFLLAVIVEGLMVCFCVMTVTIYRKWPPRKRLLATVMPSILTGAILSPDVFCAVIVANIIGFIQSKKKG